MSTLSYRMRVVVPTLSNKRDRVKGPDAQQLRQQPLHMTSAKTARAGPIPNVQVWISHLFRSSCAPPTLPRCLPQPTVISSPVHQLTRQF